MPLMSKVISTKPVHNGGATIMKSPFQYASTTGVHNNPTFGNTVPSFRDDDGAKINQFNVSVATSTESALRIPDGTTRIEFQARDAVDVRWAWQSGKAFYSQNPYFTLKSSNSYDQEFPDEGLYGETIYFAGGSSTVVELGAQQGSLN
jgi:hypothetical protein